jgi:hypothetical protein
MAGTVTDPNVLAQLNAAEGSAPATAVTTGKTVTDPSVLAQLNAASYAHPDTIRHAPESNTLYNIDKAKEGVASALGVFGGAAVSTVNQGLRALGVPVSDDPVGGIGMVTRGWEQLLGVKHTKAPTDIYGHISKATEYEGEIAGFLGAAMLPGLGEVGAAEKGTRMLVAGKHALSAVGSATTAVEGKEWGRNNAASFGLTPEQGEQVGGVVGSIAGPSLLVAGQKLAKVGAERVMAEADKRGVGLSAGAQRAQANKILAKEIKHALDHAPDSAQNVARSLQLTKKIERFHPTQPQATGAPGLVAIAQEVANKSPEAVAKTNAVQAKNLAAVEAFKEKTFGAKPGTVPAEGKLPPENLTDPAKLQLQLKREDVDLLQRKNEAEIQALSDKFRRTVDNEAIGVALREKYWEARGVAQAANTKQLAGVYNTAKKLGIVSDMTDTREAVRKMVAADTATFQNMPPVFAKVLKEYPQATADTFVREAVSKPGALKPMYTTKVVKGQAGRDEASFEELHSLYKQANREWADATIAGDSSKAHYLNELRMHLKSKVDVYNGAEYGELGQKFSKFNQNYARYSQTFKEGAGGEIAKRGRNGITRDAEDIVTKTILRAGDKKKGVQDFFAIYGNDARAAELLHDGLLDSYSKAAMKTGEFNPVAARNWLAQHHQAMSELPETAKYFQDAQKMGDAMLNRRVELIAQRQAIDNSILAKVAGNEQPEKLIASAVNDPKVMRALMEGAHTHESKQAIARSIADYVGKKGDSLEYLKAHEASLKPVMEQLGKGHWQNLVDIAEAGAILKRVEPPTAVELAKIKDPLEQATGTTVKTAISRARNLDTPLGVSKVYLMTEAAVKYVFKIKTEELARLRLAAYWDSDVAAAIAPLAKSGKVMTKGDMEHLQRIAWLYGARVEVERKQTQEHAEGMRAEEERMKENY